MSRAARERERAGEIDSSDTYQKTTSKGRQSKLDTYLHSYKAEKWLSSVETAVLQADEQENSDA